MGRRNAGTPTRPAQVQSAHGGLDALRRPSARDAATLLLKLLLIHDAFAANSATGLATLSEPRLGSQSRWRRTRPPRSTFACVTHMCLRGQRKLRTMTARRTHDGKFRPRRHGVPRSVRGDTAGASRRGVNGRQEDNEHAARTDCTPAGAYRRAHAHTHALLGAHALSPKKRTRRDAPGVCVPDGEPLGPRSPSSVVKGSPAEPKQTHKCVSSTKGGLARRGPAGKAARTRGRPGRS